MASCAYCKSCNLDDRSRGKFYCEEYRMYVRLSDSSCSRYERDQYRNSRDIDKAESDRYNYYIATALFQTNGGIGVEPNYKNMILITCLFEYMRGNPKYSSFLKEYEEYAPSLASRIRDDGLTIIRLKLSTILEQVINLIELKQLDIAASYFVSLYNIAKEYYYAKRKFKI